MDTDTQSELLKIYVIIHELRGELNGLAVLVRSDIAQLASGGITRNDAIKIIFDRLEKLEKE